MEISKKFDFETRIGGGALLSVKDSHGKVNTMTVSWGGIGVLWGKKVCTVFVRPTRFTYKMCEDVSEFSLSFFKEGDKKDVLSFCGTKSGKDYDKIKECNLTCISNDGFVVFKEAEATLKLRKLYSDFMKEECFIDKSLLNHYGSNDFHKIYVCEIIETIIK